MRLESTQKCLTNIFNSLLDCFKFAIFALRLNLCDYRWSSMAKVVPTSLEYRGQKLQVFCRMQISVFELKHQAASSEIFPNPISVNESKIIFYRDLSKAAGRSERR